MRGFARVVVSCCSCPPHRAIARDRKVSGIRMCSDAVNSWERMATRTCSFSCVIDLRASDIEEVVPCRCAPMNWEGIFTQERGDNWILKALGHVTVTVSRWLVEPGK